MKSPRPLPPPRLLTDERPIPGAQRALAAAFSSLGEALEGHSLAAVGLVLATPSSDLCSVDAAWAGQYMLQAMPRAKLWKLAARFELKPAKPAAQVVPLLVASGKRAQVIGLDFSTPGGRS